MIYRIPFTTKTPSCSVLEEQSSGTMISAALPNLTRGKLGNQLMEHHSRERERGQQMREGEVREVRLQVEKRSSAEEGQARW